MKHNNMRKNYAKQKYNFFLNPQKKVAIIPL